MRKLIINSENKETRIAVMEHGRLVELMIERPEERRLVGSIYKGKVMNVLPGMQAAFVDIGIGKNAFLYIDDALPAHEEPLSELKSDIRQVLKEGQQIVVQVTKEPFGNKGPRVTTHLSLPGRWIVYMPQAGYVGVSRRIEAEAERERLRRLAESIRFPEEGIIVRTVAEGAEQEDLESDLKFLRGLWNKVMDEAKYEKAPCVIYRDLDLLSRVVRDLMTEDMDQCIIDRPERIEQTKNLLSFISPELMERVKLFQGTGIFAHYGIEQEMEKLLRRKVWLKSGGYLVFDRTEALTVIDVNTGKYTGHSTLEDTVLKINREAVAEIAYQIRLRDIGGIIIIDFIDMTEEDHRASILKALETAIKDDRTKTHILGLTKLGLVEMTRKRARVSPDEWLFCSCPTCEGNGKILLVESSVAHLERDLLELRNSNGEAIYMTYHPSLHSVIVGNQGNQLRKWEMEMGKTLYVKPNPHLAPHRYEVSYVGSEEEVRRRALPVKLNEIVVVTIEKVHQDRPGDGIGRIDGYIVDIHEAAGFVGRQVVIQVEAVFPTYAKAKIVFIPEV